MNGSVIESDLRRWSRLKWGIGIGIVVLLQAGALLVLSDRRATEVRQGETRPVFVLLPEPPADGAWAEWLSLEDPALFALPNSRGFSGQAWLEPKPLARPTFMRSLPVSWLTQSVAWLGSTYEDYAPRARPRHRAFEDKPAPDVSRVQAPPVAFPERSTVRIKGPPDQPVLGSLTVPSIEVEDALNPTVVRAGVGPAGSTFSGVVISSSGSKRADQKALDWVRQARFKPLLRSNKLTMEWATFTFQWHTAGASPSPPPASS